MKAPYRWFVFLVASLTYGFGQAQIKSNSPFQVNIEPRQQGTTSDIRRGRNGSLDPRFLCADRNEVLIDILNDIAEPDLVKQEIEYETKNNLDTEAIYKRRLGIIKVLAGKK